MGRRPQIENEDLLSRLSLAFRADGYEGASLSRLSEATGLKKASLYHRFPRGKEQMAAEVIDWETHHLIEAVKQDLRGDRSAAVKLAAMANTLRAFYDGGQRACLFNRLTSSRQAQALFSTPIATVLTRLRDLMADVLVGEGIERETAQTRAEESLMLIQGALIYGQAMGQTGEFAALMDSIPERLLTGAQAVNVAPIPSWLGPPPTG